MGICGVAVLMFFQCGDAVKKVKLSPKMNESRHNQYIKPKVLSYHLILKTAISHFVFQIFHVNKL